jgi:hypothetical protein
VAEEEGVMEGVADVLGVGEEVGDTEGVLEAQVPQIAQLQASKAPLIT